MRTTLRRSATAWGGWLAVILCPEGPVRAQGLPPPPVALDEAAGMILRLELVVNRAETGIVAEAVMRGGHLLVPAEALQRAGLTPPDDLPDMIDVRAQGGMEADYDQSAQRLTLRVTDDWLPTRRLAATRPVERALPGSDTGMLLNYDLYAADAVGRRQASAWAEARLFGDFGVVRNTGMATYASGGGARGRVVRFDTGWTFVDDARVRTIEGGDLITRGVGWSNPVRMGGVQISRDFAVRPDIVTYPLPVFSGSAGVPGTVELFINGHLTTERAVQPGPFTLSDVPFINGAGTATIVTRDIQGRQVSSTVPFYATTSLLRAGLTDHAISVGALRRFYGLRSFGYGPVAASGSIRRGLTDRLTVELHAEGTGSLGLAGGGTTLRLGNLGVASAAVAFSRGGSHGSGHQVAVGYDYADRHVALSVRHVRRGAGFGDLSTVGVRDYRLPPRQTQATVSAAMGRAGTIAAGLLDLRQGLAVADRRTRSARLANLSYSLPLFGRANLYASVNHDLRSRSTSAVMQIAVPLGGRDVAIAGVERAAGGAFRQRASYSRAAPTDTGLGWNLIADRGDRGRYQADVTWRTRIAQVQAGVFRQNGTTGRWIGASGSVVAMDGALFAANRVNDAFVLVSATGQPDVPVYYDNQPVGRTDRRGHLLIPSVSAFYGGTYAIDPLDLSADVAIGAIDQRVAVRTGSGRILRFAIRHLTAASMTLRGGDGAFLPIGSAIVANGRTAGHVGWDGMAYLEDLPPDNRLEVIRPDGARCFASFNLPNTAVVSRLGDVTCR